MPFSSTSTSIPQAASFATHFTYSTSVYEKGRMSTQLNRVFFLMCRRRRTLPQVFHRQQLEQKGLVKHSMKKVCEKEKSMHTKRGNSAQDCSDASPTSFQWPLNPAAATVKSAKAATNKSLIEEKRLFAAFTAPNHTDKKTGEIIS